MCSPEMGKCFTREKKVTKKKSVNVKGLNENIDVLSFT